MSEADKTDNAEIALSVSTLDNQAALDKAAETTQLDERRIATDIGRGIVPPYDPETLAAFQEINETHQACLRKKSRYEVGYGFEIVPHPFADDPDDSQKDVVEDFWHGPDSRWQIGPEGTATSTPEEVLELARLDYHGIGWSALEILVNGEGDPVGLAHVPAATVRVRNTEKDEEDVPIKGHGYVQIRQGRRRYFGEAGDRYGDDKTFVDRDNGDVEDSVDELPNGPANELLFIPNPSPLSLYYGIPDWVASMRTQAADQAASEWNQDVFDNLGIPYYVIKVTGGTLTEDSKEELRQLMDNLKGTRYRTAILEVDEFETETNLTDVDGNEVSIELEPIGAREDLDMDFQAFRERNEHEISKVHEVPPILINVTSTSNRANSKEQVREFAEDVIAPEQAKFESRLYTILHQTAFDVSDWTIAFELRGADRPEKHARTAQTRVQAAGQAVTIDEAREAAGWGPLPDEHDVDGDTLLPELGQGGQEPEPSFDAQLPPPENKIGERDWAEVKAELVTKDPLEQMQFDSSNLDEGLFDFGENELYISFLRDGGQSSLYVYVDVPTSEWQSLANASSHGSYHYSNVRLDYGYLEITNFHDRLPEGPTPSPEDIPEGVPDEI